MNIFIPCRYLVLLSLLLAAPLRAFDVPRASSHPTVDGSPLDTAWEKSEWRPLDKLILGDMPEEKDFSGRYKMVWTTDYLYLLAEISDDILIDANPDPLDRYWEDDQLEIFIDEDASGGLHLNDYNAFAYHVSLDNQVVDIGPKYGIARPRLFNEHISSAWRRDPSLDHKIYWEVRISVHDDTHEYGDDRSSRVRLSAGKEIGFMLAYCDADDANGRQHFVGDIEIEPVDGDRNRGYIDASVFGTVRLVR